MDRLRRCYVRGDYMAEFVDRLITSYEVTLKDVQTWISPVFQTMQSLKDQEAGELAAIAGGYKKFGGEDEVKNRYSSKLQTAKDKAIRIMNDAVDHMNTRMAEIMDIDGDAVNNASAVFNIATDDSQILRYLKAHSDYSTLATLSQYATDHDSVASKNVAAAVRTVEDAAAEVPERLGRILDKAISQNDDWKQDRWFEWLQEDMEDLQKANSNLDDVINGKKLDWWSRLQKGVV